MLLLVLQEVQEHMGSTLDLLPKYAFSIGANTTENIPHYPSIKRITNLDGINDQSFTIDQFRNIRIDQVSIRNADGGFSQTGRFDTNLITNLFYSVICI